MVTRPTDPQTPIHPASREFMEDPQVRSAIEAALRKVREGGLEPGKDADAVSRLIRGLDARPRV
jgi:hypothetical protein